MFNLKMLTIALISLLLLLNACAVATEKKDLESRQIKKVMATVYLAHWDTKGLGEKKPSSILFIDPKDFETDRVIITRETESGKVKELYLKDKDTPSGDVWVYSSDSASKKALIHQYKNTYMITQLITGKDGGTLQEIFSIP